MKSEDDYELTSVSSFDKAKQKLENTLSKSSVDYSTILPNTMPTHRLNLAAKNDHSEVSTTNKFVGSTPNNDSASEYKSGRYKQIRDARVLKPFLNETWQNESLSLHKKRLQIQKKHIQDQISRSQRVFK